MHWFGFHGDVLKLPEGARHLRLGLRPERFHDLYPFHKAAYALPAGETEDRLGDVSPNAKAHGQASLAELVYAGEQLSQLDRIAQYGQHHRGAQAQAGRERRGIGEEAQGFQHRHRADD